MLETSEATIREITIQKLPGFPVALVYDEGHECSKGEADVMNQTLCENLRNNYAARIRKACEEHKVENATDLPEEVQAQLRKDFDAFQEGYNLGEGARQHREVDPVRRQALQLAVDRVKAALKKKGHKLADVGTEKINQLAEDAIEKNPAYMKKAEQIVEARRAATEDLEIDL